jgi:pentose-5-phosphate-3-epimerase
LGTFRRHRNGHHGDTSMTIKPRFHAHRSCRLRVHRTRRATARRVDGPLPAVFALGGVNEHNVASFFRAGAHGVAVMGSVMTSPDPAQTVAALLAKVWAPAPAVVGT